MKILSVIGFSGSGKTRFILDAIQLLKENLNLDCTVIKNIHEHQIDEEEKDSFKFSAAGAKYSITKNINNETTIFLKNHVSIKELIDWLLKGPFNIDVVFLEGFRNLQFPAILCIKSLQEVENQDLSQVRAISGIITNKMKNQKLGRKLKFPIIDVTDDFEDFINIFQISERKKSN